MLCTREIRLKNYSKLYWMLKLSLTLLLHAVNLPPYTILVKSTWTALYL